MEAWHEVEPNEKNLTYCNSNYYECQLDIIKNSKMEFNRITIYKPVFHFNIFQDVINYFDGTASLSPVW